MVRPQGEPGAVRAHRTAADDEVEIEGGIPGIAVEHGADEAAVAQPEAAEMAGGGVVEGDRLGIGGATCPPDQTATPEIFSAAASGRGA